MYPDAVYDKLVNKSVDGWRLNQLYCEEILLSKTQVNSIVKVVSYILAVTIRESDPLNSIILSEKVLDFLKPLEKGDNSKNIESQIVSMSQISGTSTKRLIIKELRYCKEDLDKLLSLKNREVVISLFPINFEKDMKEIENIIRYLEKKPSFIYEINDIGQYNLLKNHLRIPIERIIGGQGIACYNHLSIKFLLEELGLNDLSIPMEMDSRGVLKLVEQNNSLVSLRFTKLAKVPGMYSRAFSEEYFEGARFEDKIGNILNVHKYKDINIFFLDEYYSSEEATDLDGINMGELISEVDCINNASVKRKPFNLKRRLY